jgi:hypothetical protein
MANILEVARDAAKQVPEKWDYTLADLKEMDNLIRQLAEIEHWTPEEKAEALDGRRRMAPARVPEVLRQLREWVKKGLAGWPAKPTNRSRIVFCRLVLIQGGKSKPADQAKSLDTGKEAA